MPFFTGEFEQQIDAKRRMAICSALRAGVRDGEGDGFYLVVGSDSHLWLYPNRYWEKLVMRIRRSASPAQTRRLFAWARELKPDKQGRVVLPEESVQRANITDEVVLVGNLDHIEVWPKNEWQQQLTQDVTDPGELLLQAGDEVMEDLADRETE